MWTAKIKEKEIINGAIKISVEFTDGQSVVTEAVIPQNVKAFDMWVEDRIKTFNTADELNAKFELEDAISVSEPEPEPALTQEEQDRNLWLENWSKYTQSKKAMDALQEAGITPTVEETAAFDALKVWVADNRKIEYAQFIN